MKQFHVRILLFTLLLSLWLAGCTTAEPTGTAPPSPTTGAATAAPATPTLAPPGATATATQAAATATTAPPAATATTAATAAPEATATTESREDVEEAILILEPGPGSRVVSPLRLAGMADSTFEQNLVIRVLTEDGSELVETFTTIAAELGIRGPWEVEIPFTVAEEQPALVQVYETSARDGGIVHLSSVVVTLANSGEDIRPADPHPERIIIDTPANGGTVQGGTVQVSGFALASFEQTLIVEVLDQEGTVISSEPLIVNAPDLGQPGPFSIELSYSVSTAGPGRIVVRDPSPAFPADVHLASVEVMLEP